MMSIPPSLRRCFAGDCPRKGSAGNPDEWTAYRNVAVGRQNGWTLDEMRTMTVHQFMAVNDLMGDEPSTNEYEYEDGGESRFFS